MVTPALPFRRLRLRGEAFYSLRRAWVLHLLAIVGGSMIIGVFGSTIQSSPISVRDLCVLAVWLCLTAARFPPELDLMPLIGGYPYQFEWVRTEPPYRL
jgi:hypothetical protein